MTRSTHSDDQKCNTSKPAPKMQRMTQQPDHLKAPSYLSVSPPVPQPDGEPKRNPDPHERNATRYGDWELKGIAVDF